MLRFLAVLLTAFAIAGLPSQAEAKRLGGARSVGVQRNVTPPPAPPAQAARNPSQAAAATAAPAASAATASGASRWMPLLGGLAIGGLLGSMFGGAGGFGMLALIGLLLIAAVVATRFMRRPQAALSTAQATGYASLGGETVAAPPPSQSLGAGRAEPPAPPVAVPAGFDATGFLRAAKMNFIRLQDVNDRRDTGALRELTTAGMFELLSEAMQRGEVQHTDVVTLEADLLELATDGAMHRASVRFRGLMREQAGAEPVGFEEIWNLEKPVDGTSGWLLAGIQQLH